MCIVQTGWGK